MIVNRHVGRNRINISILAPGSVDGGGIVMLHDLQAMETTGAAQFLEPRTLFDGAIVGIAEYADGQLSVVYDRGRVTFALTNQPGWDEDTACEWFEFNIAGAFVGPGSPVFSEPREDNS